MEDRGWQKVTVRTDTCRKVYWKLCARLRCNLASRLIGQISVPLPRTPCIPKHGQYVINGAHEILFSLRGFIELRGIDAWSNLTVWLLWNHQVDSRSEGSPTLHIAFFCSVDYSSCFNLSMTAKGNCHGGLTNGQASWETDRCCSPGRATIGFTSNASANSVITGSLMAVATTLFTAISLLLDTKPMRPLARKPRINVRFSLTIRKFILYFLPSLVFLIRTAASPTSLTLFPFHEALWILVVAQLSSVAESVEGCFSMFLGYSEPISSF